MTESTRVQAEPSRLRRTNWRDYAIRFAFGGVITAITGFLAHAYGPVVGGLFLAFPAIFPASVTLIEQHSGKEQSAADSRGAVVGGAGLAAFGAIVWAFAGRLPAWAVLLIALAIWFLLSVGLWAILRKAGPER